MLHIPVHCLMLTLQFRLGRSSEAQEEAEGVLAQLQLRTVAYCWQHLSEDEWAMLMHRAHESIAAMAVLYEDQVGHMRMCSFSRMSYCTRRAAKSAMQDFEPL